MSFLGSLRTWLLFNNKIIPQKYNLPNNSALPVKVAFCHWAYPWVRVHLLKNDLAL